jgi:hypothetical protein
MRRIVFTLSILGLAVSTALGDGLVLNDGRKLAGKVVEKPDGYEVTVEGQTIGFAKDAVKHWYKSPKEVLGDADKQVEEAKKLYSEAVVMSDEKAAEAKFREALPKVQKAREAYVEARELFPDGYPALDEQLVNVMKLMRLVRERFHSQIAGSDAPVKVKEAPPKPVMAVKPVVAPAPDPTPSTAPAPRPVVEPSGAVSMHDALAVMVDPARRSDPAQRAAAVSIFHKASDARNPLADVATAGWMFLEKTDVEWGLSSDTLLVKGPNGDMKFSGRLDKRSDTVSVLIQSDRREVRLRTAADGAKFVTPPGSSEFKAADVKIVADQKSDSLDVLQTFFKGLDAAKFETLDDKDVSEGVKFLALKVKELKGKGQPVDALSLFVAGPASALIEKNKNKPTPEIEAAFRDLGFEKSEFGAVWGRKEGLAMDDYRKWLASGEYGMAIVQFNNDYRSVADVNVRYAMSLLMLFKALGDNRNYQRAAVSLEAAAAGASGAVRDHFLALAKSIRDEAPCNFCGGTHKVNCSVCKGKKKANLECTKCGGSGKVNSFNGVISCSGCQGKGRYNNIDCPKCKATGSTECKARGCSREVPKPTFESFAEAYKCRDCQGRGSMMRHVAFPCDDCGGIGLILQPKSDPTKLIK